MSELKIPIGPQHPALKEPEYFLFTLDGETVVGVEPRIGYMHKGVEKLMESKTYLQNIPLVERICGICNVAHTLCYCQNVEYLYDIEIPRRAEYIRTIIEELNRIHSHLLWIGIAAHEVGFDTLFMYIWRDREVVMDLIELLTGNRVSTAMNTIGGVRRDIDSSKESALRKGLDILEKRTRYFKDVAMTDPTLRARLGGVGVLTPKEVIDLCAVGPTARASGIKTDVRADDPYAGHDEIPINVMTYDSCDVFGRLVVRADETLDSIEMIRYALDHMPSGPIKIRLTNTPPVGESVSRVEAPRGEDIHYVRSNGTDKPARYKVRAPTLGNLAGLVAMLTTRGDYQVQVADLPVVLAGIDPCMCCMDRQVR
ncbi:MAG: nickel-dependent hydrogenase large subunit, partial [Candidatus Bathyarchaeia archaeon]